MNAPFCPISKSELTPEQISLLLKNQDLISQIPRATDLRSAIQALNMMARIIRGILKTGPQVNNTHLPREPDKVETGQNNDPKYKNADWIQEERVYRQQKLINPDDEGQFIDIKVLATVVFYNQNTDFQLIYDGTD